MANPRAFTKPADRIYPVFAFGTSLKGNPIYLVDRDKRDAMIAADAARSVNGGKALQLVAKRRGPQDSDLRGHSCCPGTRMLDPGARAIVLQRERACKTGFSLPNQATL
jgi:hypothetical protein